MTQFIYRKTSQLYTTFITLLYLTAKLVCGNSYTHLSSGPRFLLEPPSNVEFANTRGAEIACRATGIPLPNVYWIKKDGSNVLNVTNLRYIRSFDNNAMVFLPFNSEEFRPDIHSAVYRCVASNVHGSIATRDVHIQAVVLQSFEANVYDEYVMRENVAILRCQIPNSMRNYLNIVSWLQNDNLVAIDATEEPFHRRGQKMFTFDGHLYVIAVKRDDAYNSYKCRIGNRLTGETQLSVSSGKIIITDPITNVPPTIISTTRVIKAKYGQNTFIPCVGHAFPPPSYRWYRRNAETTLELISPFVSQKYYIIANTGFLIIKNVTRNDIGKYVCVANNSEGEDRMTFDVKVHESIQVTLEMSSNRIEIGHDFQLSCIVKGYPLHSLYFTKDTRPINTSNGGHRFKQNGAKLYISKLERRDQGCYQCFVIGDENECSQANVCLHLSENAPKFKETFTKQILAISDRLSLKCIANGNPLPTVTWTIDDHSIPETHRIQYGDYVSYNGDVVSFVNISNVRMEDGGLYRCDAINEAGTISHSETVAIIGPPFIKPMKNITVLAGHTLHIRCPFTSYPISKVSWSRGGRELPLNERNKVFENGSLVIFDAHRELDEGTYVCTAINSKGEKATRDLNIQVLKKPVISAFAFPQSLTEGMRVMVTCNVLTGDPPVHFKWLKDNRTLDVDALDVQHSSVADLASALIFRNIGQQHAGNYTCIAGNLVGDDSHTALMVVKVPPKWKIEPSDQSVVVTDRVVFNCQANGYPSPLIRWKITSDKKGEFKSISSNYRIQTLENGSLTIKEAVETDSGFYLCEAGNGVGVDLSKVVRLSVHTQAHFKSNFQLIKVRKGDQLKVMCEAFGEKPIDIKWIKNRIEIDFNAQAKYIIMNKETTDGLISEISTAKSTRLDSGTFVCITWNPFGQSELTTRVVVEEVPDTPNDVKVIERGSKFVTLKITAPYSGNSELLKYIIHTKQEKDNWDTNEMKHEFSANSQQVTVDRLRPLQTYNIRVFAVNAIGESKPSETITVTTDEEIPASVPMSVRCEALSSKSIRVQWKVCSCDAVLLAHSINGSHFTCNPCLQPPKHIENIGSITGYYIGHRINHSDKHYTFNTIDANYEKPFEFTVNNLKKSTSYAFTIQAFNSKGAGPSSAEISCRTLDKDPPSTPKVKLMSTTSTSAKLKWIIADEANAVTGFRLYLRETSNEWKLSETLKDATATSHTFQSLKCGTKYQTYLIAFNEIGDSERSDVITFQTEGLAPVAPDKLSLMSINSTFVLLHLSSWKTNSCPINNFVIQYKQQGESEWSMASNAVISLDKFPLTDLEPASWYNLMITAQSDAGSTEAEYLFATLTENGGTVAPQSISTITEEHRFRRFVQMLLPITSIFIAILVIVLFITFFGFKRNRAVNIEHLTDNLSSKCDNYSVSPAKMVYEAVQRDECNGVYCPSPYAATRVSMYFDDSSRDCANNASDNCYDMPLIKPQMSRDACEMQQKYFVDENDLIDSSHQQTMRL